MHSLLGVRSLLGSALILQEWYMFCLGMLLYGGGCEGGCEGRRLCVLWYVSYRQGPTAVLEDVKGPCCDECMYRMVVARSGGSCSYNSLPVLYAAHHHSGLQLAVLRLS